MRLRPKRSTRDNAARLLPRLAEEFFQAGDESVDDGLKGDEVHGFRILAKRFRYVLEYFRPCYGTGMDSYVETMKDLQKVLGDLNDCCASRQKYRQVLKITNPASKHKKLLAALDRLEEDLLQKFRSHWREKLGSPGVRKKFLRYLSNAPRPRRAIS